jgi:hypothetical protein
MRHCFGLSSRVLSAFSAAGVLSVLLLSPCLQVPCLSAHGETDKALLFKTDTLSDGNNHRILAQAMGFRSEKIEVPVNRTKTRVRKRKPTRANTVKQASNPTGIIEQTYTLPDRNRKKPNKQAFKSHTPPVHATGIRSETVEVRSAPVKRRKAQRKGPAEAKRVGPKPASGVITQTVTIEEVPHGKANRKRNTKPARNKTLAVAKSTDGAQAKTSKDRYGEQLRQGKASFVSGTPQLPGIRSETIHLGASRAKRRPARIRQSSAPQSVVKKRSSGIITQTVRIPEKTSADKALKRRSGAVSITRQGAPLVKNTRITRKGKAPEHLKRQTASTVHPAGGLPGIRSETVHITATPAKRKRLAVNKKSLESKRLTARRPPRGVTQSVIVKEEFVREPVYAIATAAAATKTQDSGSGRMTSRKVVKKAAPPRRPDTPAIQPDVAEKRDGIITEEVTLAHRPVKRPAAHEKTPPAAPVVAVNSPSGIVTQTLEIASEKRRKPQPEPQVHKNVETKVAQTREIIEQTAAPAAQRAAYQRQNRLATSDPIPQPNGIRRETVRAPIASVPTRELPEAQPYAPQQVASASSAGVSEQTSPTHDMTPQPAGNTSVSSKPLVFAPEQAQPAAQPVMREAHAQEQALAQQAYATTSPQPQERSVYDQRIATESVQLPEAQTLAKAEAPAPSKRHTVSENKGTDRKLEELPLFDRATWRASRRAANNEPPVTAYSQGSTRTTISPFSDDESDSESSRRTSRSYGKWTKSWKDW